MLDLNNIQINLLNKLKDNIFVRETSNDIVVLEQLELVKKAIKLYMLPNDTYELTEKGSEFITEYI